MYLFTFSMFSLFAINEISQQNKAKQYVSIFVFLFLWLVFHDGFRWETGTDWNPYLIYYRDCLSLDWTYFDIGYSSLNLIIRSISEEYSLFLIVFAIVFYFFILRSIFKYSSFPIVSLLLFYCAMLTYMGANRQLLALSICLFSIRYVINKNKYKFLMFIFIACCFHKTALVFAFIFYLGAMFKSHIYIAILLISLAFPIFNIIQNIPIVNYAFFLGNEYLSDKIDSYYSMNYGLEYVSTVSSVISIVRKLFFLVIALIYIDTLKKKSQYFPIFFNMYFISCIIFVIFNGTALQIFVSRLNLYFNVGEFFLVPLFFYLFKKRLSKVIYFLFILFYSFMLMQKSISNYNQAGSQNLLEPYKGIIINSDYNRVMW